MLDRLAEIETKYEDLAEQIIKRIIRFFSPQHLFPPSHVTHYRIMISILHTFVKFWFIFFHFTFCHFIRIMIVRCFAAAMRMLHHFER